MGIDVNGINQQSTKPHLQPKSFKSQLANLPESTVTDQKSVIFAAGTKKSLPQAISDSKNCGKYNSRGRDSGKEEIERMGIEKLGRSSSSKSSVNNTPTSFEDSSSMIVINRTAKNSKLMPPANSPHNNYLQKPRGRSSRGVSAERPTKVIDLWECSSDQRDMISSKSSIGNYWLNPIDDNASCDFKDSSQNANRVSFGESANYRSNSNYFGDGRISTGTTLSELSLPGRQLNISFTRRASDSITISWPHLPVAPPKGAHSVPHRNCLTCGTYTVNDMGLPKTEYKQKSQRIDVKSNFIYGSALGVRSLKTKKFPRQKTQTVPESVKTNVQTPLSVD